MNKKILTILIIILLFNFPIWSDSKLPDEITVVMDNNYPPYVFFDENNELKGILIDEWALFEERTGIKVKLNAMNWNDALIAMENGEYDVIDTIFKNPQREKIYAFTDSYAEIDVSIFFHKNISGINTVESIKGFAVAAKRGDQAVNVLREAGVENITLYDSYEAIIQAAKNNEVVIFVIDNPPAKYFLYKYGIQDTFNYTSPLYTGYFHRAVQLEHADLIPIIEDGFSRITAKEREVIQEKWYGKTSSNINQFTKYLVSIGFVALLIVLGLFIWNRALTRSVHKKTKELSDAIHTLSYNKSKLNAIIESLPDWVFVSNKNGTFIDFLTHKDTDNLLVQPQQFISHNMSEFFNPDLTQVFFDAITNTIHNNETITIEYNLQLDTLNYYEARFSKLNDEEVVIVVRDISERIIAQKKVINLSIMDTPTGVYNRNYFEEQIALYKKTSLEGLGLLMVDFDGLKLVNDTLGHATGDRYLKTVANLLKEEFKQADFIARIGGDEFVVVMRDLNEMEILILKKSLQEKIRLMNNDELTIPFSISIGFANYGTDAFSIEDMIKVADDFMYREKLFHRQSTKSKNIETLVTMLDERDFITQGHGSRMTRLVVDLAKALNVPESQVESLTLFAQFHDIGKIGISDAILFKPGKLSDTEYIEMKRHTEIGFRIAESSPDLIHISEWIYKHHEWWNGKGYPFGLSGEEIPLACRILTLVDAYDAMTNDRPYRNALSHNDAIKEILNHTGSQFDPNIVPVFIEMLNEMS
ncbi:MAG: transporter substrate-binding domain-containing protein [Clostridia bacterium]|nr:transporter substrate-binding domain-containing protein [Clostridia bacterium]